MTITPQRLDPKDVQATLQVILTNKGQTFLVPPEVQGKDDFMLSLHMLHAATGVAIKMLAQGQAEKEPQRVTPVAIMPKLPPIQG